VCRQLKAAAVLKARRSWIGSVFITERRDAAERLCLDGLERRQIRYNPSPLIDQNVSPK
jgi:hypothetical protein